MARSIKRVAEAWNYVLLGDQDLKPEEQTVFRLRPMTGPERAAAFDDSSRILIQGDGSQVIAPRERQVAVAIAFEHIIDVQNFPVGAPLAFPTDAEARAAYLEQVRDVDLHEIGQEVFSRSTIGVAEKNS